MAWYKCIDTNQFDGLGVYIERYYYLFESVVPPVEFFELAPELYGEGINNKDTLFEGGRDNDGWTVIYDDVKWYGDHEFYGKVTVFEGYGSYRTTFTNANLAGGVLNVAHTLDELVNVVGVFDNTNQLIVPDEITLINENALSIDLSSYGTIAGVWRVVVVSAKNLSGGVKYAVTGNTEVGIACSDEISALTTGTAKATFRLPHSIELSEVRASVTTAPTGSALTVDVNSGGTSILSTKLTIDAGEKTSTTAATPAVLSSSTLANDAEITVDIDGVGSTVAGAGLKVFLIGMRV